MEIPDHEWDQSRDNAVTPMTHLFIDTKVKETKEEQIGMGSKVIKEYIVRSGQVYTFVNLSLAEPDTAYRRFNEIFRLLTVPALDGRFRNDVNDKLKRNFAFIVDNGPGEQPSSPIVQMLLVRLLCFLNLAKVVVTAFTVKEISRKECMLPKMTFSADTGHLILNNVTHLPPLALRSIKQIWNPWLMTSSLV